MSTHRLSLDTPLGGTFMVDHITNQGAEHSAPVRFSELLLGIAAGQYTGKVRLNLNAVQAAGTITFASFVDSDTVTVNGVTLTAKTTPSGTSQWAVGASDEACANNLVAKINASALDKIVGCVAASRRGTVVIATMVAGDTVTVNGVVFTCTASPTGADPRQFALGTSDAGTAANLLTAISNAVALYPALTGVTVTASTTTLTFNYKGSLTLANSAHGTVASKIVVITSIIPGQIGNLCTLAISAHGTAVTPTGGTEGTEVIFARNNVQAL